MLNMSKNKMRFISQFQSFVQDKRRDSETKSILEAIKKSYDNQIAIYRLEQVNIGIKDYVKHFIWLLVLLIFSPKINTNDRDIIFVYSELHIKIIGCKEKENVIGLGKYLCDFNSIRKHKSIYSVWNIRKRIKVYLSGLFFGIKFYRLLKVPLTYIIEYYSIDIFLKQMDIRSVVCAGIFDRYATVLSFLCKGKNIKFIGTQHGIVATTAIPHKVYFDEYNVFDECELSVAKKIIENTDCKYNVKIFESNVMWSQIENYGKLIIAIASQDRHTNVTKRLVKLLCEEIDLNKIRLILYPHYREDISVYQKIQQDYPELYISHHERYYNIDILITYYSTIAYDYFQKNKSIDIMCLRLNGFNPGYYCKEGVCVCDSAETLCSELKNRYPI